MHHRRISPKFAIILLLLLSALIWRFSLATAAGTVGDGTPASCTEDALLAALQGGGTVTFDCGQTEDAPVTIPIRARIALNADTVFDGGATQALILNGGDAGTGDRNGVGIFAVAAGVTVEIRNLTILNAGDSAIVSQGALTLDSVVIQEARAAQCAGVQSTGTLTVRRGMLTTNTAESIGGNACVLAGTATFENADVRFGRAEQGGGIYVGGGDVNVIDSYIAYNLSMGPGAGIRVAPAVTLTLRGVGLVNNVADPASPDALGGGIYNAGTSTIIGAVMVDNEAFRGGGIHNAGNLSVRESDMTGNFAADVGGGLWNGGQATWSTSSLARNTATGNGGGFYTTGDLTVLNSTVAENNGASQNQIDGGNTTIHYSTLNESAAALNVSAGTATVRGSIVTGCTGALTSQGHNLDTGNSCAFAQTGDLNNSDPLLGALQQIEGRYTWHYRPADGSPAIDTGEATCADANNEDQHRAVRPGGVACDIGAVEVAGVLPTPTTASTATHTPTVTATPSPTVEPTETDIIPVTETATPEGPYTIPAPVTGAPEPSILVSPEQGAVGDTVTVSGEGLAANGFVQLIWLQDGITFNGQRVAVESDNDYAVTVTVPDAAAPGPAQLCAAVGRDVRARLVCADFTVDGAGAGAVQVTLPDAIPASAQVRLLDHAGNTLYSVAGNNSRQISLSGINAGAYHLAVTGGTANYEMASAQIVPGVVSQSNVQRMVDSLDPVSGQFCESDTASVALIQAKTSYAGYYSGVTAPSGNPSARQGDMVMESSYVNKVFAITDKPQPEFGTFLSGVGLLNEFRVQTSGFVGSIQRVEYWVRGAGQSTWTKMGEASASPYPVTYNMGNLPPGRAEMYVAPVVDGQRQCGRRAVINMMNDPMKASFIRQGLTLWSPAQQLYRMYGRMPQVAILPIVFPEDPWEVEPLGDIGTRLDAYVEIRGEMGLNQVMRLGMLVAETQVKVLGITPSSLNKSLNLLPGGATVVDVNDPRSLAIGTGRLHLGKLFAVSFNSPKIVVFSYLGLVNVNVGFRFSMDGDLYFESIVYPLAPAVDLRLEPQASASFGVLVGADVLAGLVEGSVEVGVAAALSLPLRIYAAATPEIGFLNPRFCLSAYIQFHWSAVWGIFGGSSGREPFFNIPSDCQLAAGRSAAAFDALEDRRVMASPALTSDEDGRMISVYIEDSAPNAATASPQVWARTWNPGTNGWNAAVALTAPGAYVASPSVALYGGDGRAVAAWVQSTQSEGDSTGGDFAAALAQMEIYVAFFDGSAWGDPIRLTTDALPDGNPTLAGDANGATLAWVRHVDGNLSAAGGTVIAVQHWDGLAWTAMELLTGADTTTGVNPVTDTTRTSAANRQPSLARASLGAASEIALAWTYEDAGVSRVAVAHSRAQAGLWFMLDTSTLPAQSSAPAVTVPTGQAEQVEIAFTVAPADTDGASQSAGNMAHVWTARLRDLDTSTSVQATPLRDDKGAPVFGEKPELQLATAGERLLTFRHFGKPGTDSAWGQLAVTRAAGGSSFAAPLNLTSGEQHWLGAATVNRSTNQLALLGVQVRQIQPPAALARDVHAALATNQLSASGDPLLSFALPADADPAIEGPLAVSQPHAVAGTPVTVTATLRNLGRDDVSVGVRWWAGQPGTGTLLGASAAVTLTFNQTVEVARTLLADGTAQPISAEIVTTGGNRVTANDVATVEIGALPSPSVTGVSPTQLYDNALAITYAPPSAPGVAGYRILRRDDVTPWTLVGESVALVHYDAQLTPGTRYCYAVQAYDAAGLLSAASDEVCNTPAQTKWEIYLPSVQR
jgi:predicted outer membrane repeat protein